MKKYFNYRLLSLILINLVNMHVIADQMPMIDNSCNSLNNRSVQLERISNAHSQLMTQIQQQLIDIQRDIELIRGQIQENQYQLTKILEWKKNIVQQTNKLLDLHLPDFQRKNSPRSVYNKNAIQDMMLKDGRVNNKNKAADAYNKAVKIALHSKQYNNAIMAFLTFIQCYPNSIYQANANYWLGQLNYNQGKKNDAIYYFALVATNYAKSSKAPDALFKVGIIMQEKGQKDKAKSIYNQMCKLYPKAKATRQAQKRLARL